MSVYKTDRKELEKLVRNLENKYSFKGPLHFTDFTNLKSIFDCGSLKSRAQCERESLNFLDAANHDIIEHTKVDIKRCARFYFKELTPTLYNNEGIKENDEKPHVPIPVYLLFNKELIYQVYTVFSDGNARSKYTRFGKDAGFFKEIDWEKTFNRGSLTGDTVIRWEYTRKRNAELLSIIPVSLEYLDKVIFRCEADRKRAYNVLGNDYKYEVNRSMFNNNNNYIVDYNIKITKKSKSKSLKLEWSFNNYTYNSYKNRYIIIAINDNIIIQNVELNFPNDLGLYWEITIENLPDEELIINYYIDNVLCIEEYI